MKYKYFREIPFLLFAAAPGLFFSYMSLQEPWTLFRLARLVSSIQENHILQYATSASSFRVEHLGGEFVQTAILLASKWPVEWLSVLPIGSLLFAICYYAISFKLSRSVWMARFIAVYAGWYYPRLISQYGIQTYVWTNLLFLGFLIVFLEWIKRRRTGHSILIMIIFVVTFLFYQTTPLWIIIALAVASVLIHVRKHRHSSGSRVSWALPLVCVVIYLAFDTVLYGNFLKRATSEVSNADFLQSIGTKILAPLFRQELTALGPYEIAPINPEIATWSTLISLIIMIVPVVYWFFVKTVDALKGRDVSNLFSCDEDVFIWSVITVAVGHAVGYLSYGAISTRVIPLVFPFLLLVLPGSLRLSGKILPFSASLFLALTSVVGFLSYSPIVSPDVKASDLGNSAFLLDDRAVLLADAGVFGSFQVNAAQQGKLFEFSWLDAEQYHALIDPDASSDRFSMVDYVVVDKYDKPLISIGWKYYEPFLKYVELIDRNPGLSRIYDSSHIIVYQLSDRPLPSNQSDLQLGQSKPASFLASTLGIAGAFVFIVLVPGGILLLLIKVRFPIDFGGPLVYSSLCFVAGVSLVTLGGYLANFSFLGLNSILWVIFVFALVAAGFLIRHHGQTLALLKLLKIEILFTLVLVISWAILMTSVSYMRTQNSSDYVEFYVTQNENSGRPIINIASHLSVPSFFSVQYFIGEIETATAPFIVSPGQTIAYELDFLAQNNSEDDVVVLLNTHDRLGYLKLNFLMSNDKP